MASFSGHIKKTTANRRISRLRVELKKRRGLGARKKGKKFTIFVSLILSFSHEHANLRKKRTQTNSSKLECTKATPTREDEIISSNFVFQPIHSIDAWQEFDENDDQFVFCVILSFSGQE